MCTRKRARCLCVCARARESGREEGRGPPLADAATRRHPRRRADPAGPSKTPRGERAYLLFALRPRPPTRQHQEPGREPGVVGEGGRQGAGGSPTIVPPAGAAAKAARGSSLARSLARSLLLLMRARSLAAPGRQHTHTHTQTHTSNTHTFQRALQISSALQAQSAEEQLPFREQAPAFSSLSPLLRSPPPSPACALTSGFLSPPFTRRQTKTASLPSRTTAPSGPRSHPNKMQRKAPLRALVRRRKKRPNQNPRRSPPAVPLSLPQATRARARRVVACLCATACAHRASRTTCSHHERAAAAAKQTLSLSPPSLSLPQPHQNSTGARRAGGLRRPAAAGGLRHRRRRHGEGASRIDHVIGAGPGGPRDRPTFCCCFRSLVPLSHARLSLSPPSSHQPTNPDTGPHVALRGERVHQRPLRGHGGAPRRESSLCLLSLSFLDHVPPKRELPPSLIPSSSLLPPPRPPFLKTTYPPPKQIVRKRLNKPMTLAEKVREAVHVKAPDPPARRRPLSALARSRAPPRNHPKPNPTPKT